MTKLSIKDIIENNMIGTILETEKGTEITLTSKGLVIELSDNVVDKLDSNKEKQLLLPIDKKYKIRKVSKMNKEIYEKLIKRINHRIDRNKERINDLKKRKDQLSIHGHWELGYFEGIDSELDNLLGIVETLYNEPVHMKKWEVKISLYDDSFLMWIPANSVEQIGYGDLLVDGIKTIKTQGAVEYVKEVK